ncbi:MAG: COX15/CtaA family protein, partial [Flavobacteriaceae bacterium]|nr:COX15/CtaA family protein [Flavobacteriaceae bacterium]
PALIQFTHRILAYLLVLATIYMYFIYRRNLSKISSNWLNSSVLLICLQLILGVLIVLNINPGIPLFYGVSHQLVGLLFFTSLLFLKFSLRKDIN